MPTAAPGRPTDRREITAEDVEVAVRRYERIAYGVTKFLVNHGLSRRDCTTVLRIAGNYCDLLESSKSQEGKNG